jgi:hypothetical protein
MRPASVVSPLGEVATPYVMPRTAATSIASSKYVLRKDDHFPGAGVFCGATGVVDVGVAWLLS